MEHNSTVSAISTPFGIGGIGIIRITGPAAFSVAGKIFRANNGRSIQKMPGYTSVLGRVCDGDEYIDEAILQVFRAPKSYTGEDVAEISCHGGIWILRRVLRLCLENGAAPANPGEFTKRAFLNGKLDLTQAEAVMDLISAQGESAAKAALSAREGSISKKISGITKKLVAQSAHLAAWADFPDEDLENLDMIALLQAIEDASLEITRLLNTCDTGKVLREGISITIAGKPNVGKSTLMNLLLGDDRSIVTDIPGTTRDVIEENLILGGFLLKLADTAGIREAADLAEQAGVKRSIKKLDSAELVLAVFDSSAEFSSEDGQLIQSLDGKRVIAVINKTDLPQKLDIEEIKSRVPRVIGISAKNGEGLELLENMVTKTLGLLNPDSSAAIIQSERQRKCLKNAMSALVDAKSAFESGMLDAVNVCIDYALDELLTLTGERASERVIDEVFTKFCVGK